MKRRVAAALPRLLSVVLLCGCGDRDMAMRSAALSLETLFSRILLKESGVSWRYTATSVGRCAEDLTPKYCVPVSMTGFKKLGWSQYEATYSMRRCPKPLRGYSTGDCSCASPAKLGREPSHN